MLQKSGFLFCSFSFLTYLCRRNDKPQKTDDIEQKLLLLFSLRNCLTKVIGRFCTTPSKKCQFYGTK